MIKSISLLTRREGITHEQFVRHWLEIHGPLAYAVPGLRRYVQSHILAERTRPDIPATAFSQPLIGRESSISRSWHSAQRVV